MRNLPTIADVKCSRIVFRPGDRVIVRVYRRLEAEQAKRLKRSIQRWAGADVEILIYDATLMDVRVEKADAEAKLVAAG